MKVASFFAGVGGIDIAFTQSNFHIIWANEIDANACKTYRLNFSSPLIEGDIRTINENDIPDFDVMIAGFPCQAFSVAGYRKGFEDERGNLFFELERIFKAKKPQVIFLENVKNLTTHDNGNTFKVILDKLHNASYFVHYKVLNACEYGNIPQNRERIYIVAFNNEDHFKKFSFPEPIELTNKLSDYIDFDNKQDDKYYYSEGKCKFFDKLKENITSYNTLYQWRRIYVRENKKGLCPTLTANMGTGGHNVPLIKSKYGIRKLTPRECFNLMGYPSEYKLANIAPSHLYKQAGNSVAINVVRRIATNIYEATH